MTSPPTEAQLALVMAKHDPEDSRLMAEVERSLQCLQTAVFDSNGLRKFKDTIEWLTGFVREATESTTAIPKPLKLLHPHLETLADVFERRKTGDEETDRKFADLLSAVAMVDPAEATVRSLQFKLKGHFRRPEDLGSWGLEYQRHISAQIVRVWNKESCPTDDTSPELLAELIESLVNVLVARSGEIEACDLLLELGPSKLDLLRPHLNAHNYDRVCQYVLRCAGFTLSPEDEEILTWVADVLTTFGAHCRALRVALKLGVPAAEVGFLQKLLTSNRVDGVLRKQLVLLWVWNRGPLLEQKLPDSCHEADDGVSFTKVANNTILWEKMRSAALSLHLQDQVHSAQVFKGCSDLKQFMTMLNLGGVAVRIDMDRRTLAKSVAYAFANAGFGDGADDGFIESTLLSQRKRNLMCATAGLGLVHLWDLDQGVVAVDKVLKHPASKDDFRKAGALLALGLLGTRVHDVKQRALADLRQGAEAASTTSAAVRIGALLGLGLAHAGSCTGEVIQVLTSVLKEKATGHEVLVSAAIALGLVCVGSGNLGVAKALASTLKDRLPRLKGVVAFDKYYLLAIGLVFFGWRDKEEQQREGVLSLLPEPQRSTAITFADCCANVGCGNVVKIQRIFHVLGIGLINMDGNDEAGPSEGVRRSLPVAEVDSCQSMLVMGLALLTMGDPVGTDMVSRSLGHVLSHSAQGQVKAAALSTLALMFASSPPHVDLLDTVVKYSHDDDPCVAASAILSLGIIGAGTKNPRLISTLKQLASFHLKDPHLLLAVQLAQSLL